MPYSNKRRPASRSANPVSTLSEVLLLITITAISTTLLVSIVLPNRLPVCPSGNSLRAGV